MNWKSNIFAKKVIVDNSNKRSVQQMLNSRGGSLRLTEASARPNSWPWPSPTPIGGGGCKCRPGEDHQEGHGSRKATVTTTLSRPSTKLSPCRTLCTPATAAATASPGADSRMGGSSRSNRGMCWSWRWSRASLGCCQQLHLHLIIVIILADCTLR